MLKSSEAVDLLEIMFELCLKRKTAVLDKMGITEIEYNFFMQIARSPEMNIMKIAETMSLPQTRISRMTDKFLKKGLLKRELQKTDQRVVRLVYTDRGNEMYEFAIENKCIGENRIKEILKEEKYKEFKEILEQLIDNYTINNKKQMP